MTCPPDPLRGFCRWLLAAGLIAVPSALFAQERGTCVTAAVPGAFTLPDGRLHAAGRLTLCLDRAFTPSVGLHRVAVEGGTLALVRSRRVRAEMGSGRDAVVVFHRRHGGALDLVGYAVPVGGTTWSYAFDVRPPAPGPGPAAPAVSDDEVVALVARRSR